MIIQKILAVTIFCMLMYMQGICQFVVRINDFSEDYNAQIIFGDVQLDEVFKHGRIDIFSNNGNKIMLEVQSQAITFEREFSQNIKSINIPYKEQSVIIFDDFNFDGQNDFAIQQNYSSKGPTYFIYFLNKDQFEVDDQYSCIIASSQGNFTLDKTTKKIHTQEKSGCCWHASSVYVIKEGKPYLEAQNIEKKDIAYTTIISKTIKDGEMVEQVEKYLNLDEEGIKIVMSFNLLNKNKKVILFNINDRILNYALVNNENKVEFNYPPEVIYQNPDFLVNKNKNEVIFRNKDVEYIIYQTKNGNTISALGINVFLNGKEYNLKGDITTLSGNIQSIPKLDNVVWEK